MLTRNRLLYDLLLCHYATPNNFAWRYGSYVYPARMLLRYEKAGYVSAIEVSAYEKPSHREQFYCLTKEGAKLIGLQDDYKYIGEKRKSNLQHETAKIDIVLALIHYYHHLGQMSFSVEYPSKGDWRPDAIIHIGDYDFVLEVERSRYTGDIVKNKIEKVKYIKFKDYGLSINTRILFVIAAPEFDPYCRPYEYTGQHRGINGSTDLLNNVIKTATGLSNRFLFLPLHLFPFLNTPVWRNAHGEKVMLIQ